MTRGSKQRQRLVPRMLPMAERRRQFNVRDSSALENCTKVAAQAKPSGGYGRKVVRPLAKMKKALVAMVVTKGRKTRSATSSSSSHSAASQAPYSMGMGMAPAIGPNFGASFY